MSAFERWSVWISSVLVTLTGAIYLWMKYLLPESTGFSVIRHPLQPLVLKLHIMVAPLFLLALGAVTLRHIWRHIRTRTREGRRTGWSAAFTAAPMILTGYLLQVLTDERWVRVVALAHVGTGIIFAVGLVLHQIVLRKGKPAIPDIGARADRRPRSAAKDDRGKAF